MMDMGIILGDRLKSYQLYLFLAIAWYQKVAPQKVICYQLHYYPTVDVRGHYSLINTIKV